MTMLECAMYLCNQSYYTRTVNPQCGPSDSPRSRSGNGCFTTKDPLERRAEWIWFWKWGPYIPNLANGCDGSASNHWPRLFIMAKLFSRLLIAVDQQSRLQLAVGWIAQSTNLSTASQSNANCSWLNPSTAIRRRLLSSRMLIAVDCISWLQLAFDC